MSITYETSFISKWLLTSIVPGTLDVLGSIVSGTLDALGSIVPGTLDALSINVLGIIVLGHLEHSVEVNS